MANTEVEILEYINLNDMYILCDGDFLNEDIDFNKEIDTALSEIPSEALNFQCKLCKKVYKSIKRLERHNKSKHKPECSSNDLMKEYCLKKLHPLKLKCILNECVAIVAKDT